MFRRSATLPLEDAPLHALPPCESSSLSELESLLSEIFEASPPVLHNEDPWSKLTDEQKQNLALRFLRYQLLKVDKAYAQIEKCVQWRNAEQPFQKQDDALMGRKTGIPLLISSTRGKDGQILVYGPARFYCKAEVDHALQEAGAKALFEKLLYGLHGQVVLVLDFDGFSVNNVDFVCLKNGIRVFRSYYPEVFVRIVVTRYPRWLYGTWKCVVPLLDNRTVQRVHWVSEKDMSKELGTFFDKQDIPRWLGGEGKDGETQLFTGQSIDVEQLAKVFE